MGAFKREARAFALQRKGDDSFVDIKCLYLYQGVWRLARAERTEDGELHLLFRTMEYRDKWFQSEECLALQRWPLCEREFVRRFTQVGGAGLDPLAVWYEKRSSISPSRVHHNFHH